MTTTLTGADYARFYDVVAPAFGLDDSFRYSDADIANYLATYAAQYQWHLFLVFDGSGHPVLISVEAESADDAESLAIADARECWDLDDEMLGTEYVGVIDRRVNKRF